jgi:transcriptional regulator with XRE-family HTH domain
MKAYKVKDKIVLLNGTGLKRCREALGRTLEDVASACGCSRQAVNMWEEGKASPHDDSMKILIRFFGKETLDKHGALQVANS